MDIPTPYSTVSIMVFVNLKTWNCPPPVISDLQGYFLMILPWISFRKTVHSEELSPAETSVIADILKPKDYWDSPTTSTPFGLRQLKRLTSQPLLLLTLLSLMSLRGRLPLQVTTSSSMQKKTIQDITLRLSKQVLKDISGRLQKPLSGIILVHTLQMVLSISVTM